MPDAEFPALSPAANPVPFERNFTLQAYSYGERSTLLPSLTAAFTHCGGWVLERKTTSATTTEFRLELQLRGIVDFYAALIAAGVELTSTAHTTLTGLCTCRRHGGSAVFLREVLTLTLEISFLEDVTLHSLLMTGSGLA